MAIQFHQIDVKYSPKNKRILKEWVSEAVSMEKLNVGALNIVFCSDEHLLGINRQYLNHDYYTDIITFNYNEKDIISGDLFISSERVKDNALKNSVTLENEMQRVIIHGVMHLCGYKDKKIQDREVMRKMEDKYLKKLQKKLV